MNATNRQMEKVLYHDKMMDTNIQHGEDADGEYYVVCDTHEDMAFFINLVNEVLGIDFDSDWDVWQKFGAQLVFSDEYTFCSDCGEVIRISPDSYHWQPDFYVGDGFIACNKCFNGEEDYQEDYLNDRINHYQSANQLLSDEQLESLGFERISDHEYFMGDNVTDTPKRLYFDLEDKYDEILFSIDGVGQFNTDYSVWVRGEK